MKWITRVWEHLAVDRVAFRRVKPPKEAARGEGIA